MSKVGRVAGRAGWMDQTNNIPKWIPVIHTKVRAGLKGYNSRSNNQKENSKANSLKELICLVGW